MKILHIVSAKVWGGGETAALSMCKTLRENGHNVYVVVSGDIGLLQEKFSGIGNVSSVNFSWGKLFSCVRQLRNILVKQKIDVVHTHTGKVIPFALLASRGLKTKVIAYRHNAIPNKTDIIHKCIYRHLAAMVCVSYFVKRAQEAKMPQWVKDKLHVVYNGVETSDEIDGQTDSHEAFVVGYAGRIEENKGLLHLVKALVSLENKNVILKIAGDDTTKYAQLVKDYLQDTVYERNVSWLGYMKDMASFYKQIDLLVCPSLVPEAFGLSICEAMYYGKAVITSDNGAQGEIVADGIDGFLVPPGNEAILATKIKELATDRQLCQKMGFQAQEKIREKYTMQSWYDKMMAVYKKVLREENKQ